jgi:hypothetical protein
VDSYAVDPISSSPLLPRDVYHFDGPAESVARKAPAGDFTGGLDADTRGAIPKLAPASPGRVAALVAPLDQGPANGVVGVEVRCRSRFRFAR